MMAVFILHPCNLKVIHDLRRMNAMRWLAIIFAASVIAACSFPWVVIGDKNIFFGGFESTNNTFGKPGLLHAIFCSACIVLLLINRLWSLRTSFFISAINIAWALRNFLLLAACTGGECPVRQPA